MNASIPEEAIVDAFFSDPLIAAALLAHIASRDSVQIRSGLLDDFARQQNVNLQKLESVIKSMLAAGLFSHTQEGVMLTVTKSEALRHAAVLRGIAYARYRQKDENQVEITLSSPAHPSRLMEVLPTQGFSWTRLFNTKDSLIELASQAEQRLVIVSPFLDDEGLEWIAQLFESTSKRPVKRTLVLRGRDQAEIDALRRHAAQLSANRTELFSYAISHDPAVRSTAIETFHAKIMLADIDKAYVGSANMTRWSRDFSMECGVIIRGPAVRPVATLVEAMIRISSPINGVMNGNS